MSELARRSIAVADWLQMSRPRFPCGNGQYHFPAGPLWDDMVAVIERISAIARCCKCQVGSGEGASTEMHALSCPVSILDEVAGWRN